MVNGVMDHRKKTPDTDAYTCTLRVSFKTTVLNLESGVYETDWENNYNFILTSL